MIWPALLFTLGTITIAAETSMNADMIGSKIAGSRLQAEFSAVLDLELPSPAHQGLDDFEITPADHQSFAIDGAGGWYYVLGDGRILLVDSEGSAGVVAADFDAFVAMATGLPGWRDALRFMGDTDLEAARQNWLAVVDQWQLDAAMQKPWPYEPQGFSVPTPGEARDAIRDELGISATDDAFAALFEAVKTLNADISVRWGGNLFEPLGRQY